VARRVAVAATYWSKAAPSVVFRSGRVGPSHATPNTVPLGATYSRTTVPEDSVIRCTVYADCEVLLCDMACITAWSLLMLLTFWPNAACAGEESAQIAPSIAQAMPV
jgi:hypothetical protein